MGKGQEKRRGRPKGWHGSGLALWLLREYTKCLENLRRLNGLGLDLDELTPDWKLRPRRIRLALEWQEGNGLTAEEDREARPNARLHLDRAIGQVRRHRAAGRRDSLRSRAALLAWCTVTGQKEVREADLPKARQAMRRARQRLRDERKERRVPPPI